MTQVTQAQTVAASVVDIAKAFNTSGAEHQAAVKASNLTLVALVEAGVLSVEFYEEVVADLMRQVLVKLMTEMITQ